MRAWVVVFVIVAAAAGAAATGRAGPPPSVGILQPAGGGVRIAYVAGDASVRCSFGLSGRLPQVTCVSAGRGGGVQQGFGARMDRDRVVFFRVRAGRSMLLSSVSQRVGEPVYGAFQRDPRPRLIELAAGASIGFLGTNVDCTAVRDGGAPGMRCLAHAGRGLPGPCCGPNYALLVGSRGFFLSPRRLEELLVVDSGVHSGTAPHRPPYKIVAVWRRS